MLSTLAGLLYVIGFIPYIVAILRGETKPSSSTWIIWTMLDSITLGGMLTRHQISGTLVAGLIGSLTIAILSLTNGWRGWTMTDLICLGGAAVGIAFWALTWNADLAIVITMVVMMIGAVPTIKSAWLNPKAENKLAWAVYASGCIIGVMAISEWSITGALQPITFLVIDGSVALVVFFRK
jgi:hypothetical protein